MLESVDPSITHELPIGQDPPSVFVVRCLTAREKELCRIRAKKACIDAGVEIPEQAGDDSDEGDQPPSEAENAKSAVFEDAFATMMLYEYARAGLVGWRDFPAEYVEARKLDPLPSEAITAIGLKVVQLSRLSVSQKKT